MAHILLGLLIFKIIFWTLQTVERLKIGFYLCISTSLTKFWVLKTTQKIIYKKLIKLNQNVRAE